jgi:hypothetical protein
MATCKLLALSGATAVGGRAFGHWHDDHLQAIRALPGYRTARRSLIESAAYYSVTTEERARVEAALAHGEKPPIASMALDYVALEDWPYPHVTEYDFDGGPAALIETIARHWLNAGLTARLYAVTPLTERIGVTAHPNYRVIGLSRMATGRAQTFHRWYDRHVAEVLGTTGMDTAQRFRVESMALAGDGRIAIRESDWHHLAIYDVTAQDYSAVADETARRMEAGEIEIHPSFGSGITLITVPLA